MKPSLNGNTWRIFNTVNNAYINFNQPIAGLETNGLRVCFASRYYLAQSSEKPQNSMSPVFEVTGGVGLEGIEDKRTEAPSRRAIIPDRLRARQLKCESQYSK